MLGLSILRLFCDASMFLLAVCNKRTRYESFDDDEVHALEVVYKKSHEQDPRLIS